jgi:hypothetical protein
MRTSCVSRSADQQISKSANQQFFSDEANLDSLRQILSGIQQIGFS